MTRTALALSLAALAAAGAASCGRQAPKTTPEVVAVHRAPLPDDPLDPAWNAAPVHATALLLQDMVEPRLLEASTPEARVRALTDGGRIAFRLDWDDPSGDDLPGVDRFTDACAVQLPAAAGADVPSPLMGEAGRTVEITYWRASWQAMVDGRGDSIEVLYPNATVDHYPFQAGPLAKDPAAAEQMAALYAPARSLGRAMAGPRTRPVEDLVAEGPGTLSPAAEAVSEGRGERTATGWAVVLTRPIPAALRDGRTQVAVAVWQGAEREAGSRKMRSGWIPLSIEAGR